MHSAARLSSVVSRGLVVLVQQHTHPAPSLCSTAAQKCSSTLQLSSAAQQKLGSTAQQPLQHISAASCTVILQLSAVDRALPSKDSLNSVCEPVLTTCTLRSSTVWSLYLHSHPTTTTARLLTALGFSSIAQRVFVQRFHSDTFQRTRRTQSSTN